MNYQWQCVLLILFFNKSQCQTVSSSNGTNGDDRCFTRSSQIGHCTLLKDCKSLIDAVKSVKDQPAKKFLLFDEIQRNFCRVEGKQAYACCVEGPVLEKISQITEADEEFERKREQFENTTSGCGYDAPLRIVGGSIARIDQFPWIVQLHYLHRLTGRTSSYCGGVLINSNYVLSAAHCCDPSPFARKSIELSFVRLGEWNTSSNIDCDANGFCADEHIDITIQHVILHPEYSQQSKENDIAIVRLAHAISEFTSFIRPICLPFAKHLKNKSFVNVNLTVAGWGRTENGTRSEVKRFVKVPGVSKESCAATYQQLNIQISDLQICAGGVRGYDSCQGDSGSALMNFDFADLRHQFWYLVGLVSFGPRTCGGENWPAVYTRINIKKYLEWILNSIDL